MSGSALRIWTASLAGIAALAVAGYGLTAQHGWLGTTFLWPAHLFGLAMIALAIHKGAPKLLLLLVPVFVIPLAMGTMLLYACSQGDCL